MNGNPRVGTDDIDMIIGNMGSKEMAEKADEAKGMETPEELPILPIRESVLYPKMILPFMVSQERLIKLIDAALVTNKMIGIVALRNKEATDVKPGEFARGRMRRLYPEDAQDAQQQHSPAHSGNLPHPVNGIYPGGALPEGQGYNSTGLWGEDDRSSGLDGGSERDLSKIRGNGSQPPG